VAFDDVLQYDGLVGVVHHRVDAAGEARDASFDAKTDGQYAEDAEIAASAKSIAGEISGQ
jgi:hypothetical protein